MRRIFRLAVIALVAPFAGALGLLAGCQSKLLYHPRPYGKGVVAAWEAEPGAKAIDYVTKDGRQQAYLYSSSPRPERLWIACGGNAMRALDWAGWLREQGREGDAWLLVDYPGYGACEGKPHPESIRRSLKAVVPVAAESLGWSLPADADKLRFFGQSLGSSVCLMAAEEWDIRRGVLLAPFTSTMEMTKALFGVDLGFLVRHRYDNAVLLQPLANRGEAEVFILHGSRDEVIPAAMSRELAEAFPGVVRHTEIPGGRHNDLADVAGREIRAALDEARK